MKAQVVEITRPVPSWYLPSDDAIIPSLMVCTVDCIMNGNRAGAGSSSSSESELSINLGMSSAVESASGSKAKWGA